VGGGLAFDLLAALPDGEAAGCVASRDWGASIALAGRHGFAPSLDYALRASGVQPPERDARALERYRKGCAGSSLRVLQSLRLALGVLAAEEIEVIPLKGWTLGRLLYPDPSIRTMSDVDLLVKARDEPRALSALRRAGGLVEGGPSSALGGMSHRQHLPPIHGIGAVPIELHRVAISDYGAVMSAEPLFSRAKPIDVDGLPAYALAIEDLFLYLAGHAVEHTFERLSWLLDLKLLVRSAPIDWAEVARSAKHCRRSGSLEWTMSLLERVQDLPDHATRPRRRRLTVRLASVESAIEGHWFARTMLRRNLLRAVLADSQRRAAQHVCLLAKERVLSAARRRREITR
jgi:hypothetical protein